MTNVIKSPNDSKEYRVIRLANGLTALLISDLEHQNDTDVVLAESTSKENVTLNEFQKDADTSTGHHVTTEDGDSVVATDDGDSSWTDVTSSGSNAADDSEDSMCSNDSDDSDDDSFSGGFHGGQRHKRAQCVRREYSNEKLAAAGLCIGVGSFSDPAELPGLAHFLEHMVFMGSKKYPNDNDFDDYLSQYGGSSNAYTECEQTIFHFDVQKQYFHSALDRFAQFFIHPLLKKDSVDREIEAVDSEFMLSFPSDSYRIEQLVGSFANDGHPMSKFMWGNIKTLKQRPASHRIDIYSNLKSFYKQYYVAQHMTLAVQSQESLDKLESWVRDIFSAIQHSSLPKITFDHLLPPFENKSFTKIYKVVPVKTINQVILKWALPSQMQHYRIKPLHYLGWLIGHEGKGSLASYLKRKNWSVYVESGNSETGLEHNTTCSFFDVIITLSDEGLQQLYQVITTVFQYIAMLQSCGPKVEIYDEIRKIEELDFRFEEPVDPQDSVEELCSSMQLYESDHFLTGGRLLMEYNEQVIKECIDALTANRVNITVLSKYFDKPGYCRSKEKWYKTPYRMEDIPNEWLQKWSSPEVNPELTLPSRNPYIAEDFEIKAEDVPLSKYPVIINDTPISRLWYKKDDVFKVPRAYASFCCVSSIVNSSPHSMCMTELFVKLLIHNLSEVVYDAELAQISYDIQVYDNGILLKFGGFNDKLVELFHVVIDHLIHFSVTDEVFHVFKHELETVYVNQMMKPGKLNIDIRLSVLQHIHWTLTEKLSQLPNVDRSTLLQFAKDIFKSVYVEGLVQGNISAEEAKALELHLLTSLNVETASRTESSEITVSQLPASNVVIFRTKSKNLTDSNCVITNYYQHGPANINEYVMMELLMLFMEEPCFDWLRTRKQLGYDVENEIRVTRGILAFTITICGQSSKHNMKYLDDQIEAFIADLNKHRVQKMSDNRFRKLVTSMIKTKCIEDCSLSDECDRNWAEILDRTYIFDRRQIEIEALKKLSIEDFKNWSTCHLLSSEYRKKLSVQVCGNKTCKKPAKVNGSSNSHGRKKATYRRSIGVKGQVSSADVDESEQSGVLSKVLLIDDVSDFRTKFGQYPPSKILP